MARKISLYGVLVSVCIVLGYLETLISFDFIAPGIKLGLANTVALLLIGLKDIKGAFAVNIVRILLSGLLFSSPQTLMYSIPAGIVSVLVTALFMKIIRSETISFIGFSIIGALVHNLVQTLCAVILLGKGILTFLPFLILSAAVSGFLTGAMANAIFKRIKK